jgi:NAD(P)-dependent dehydrogenase (short-subunit alcohol dehydrogenase family)
MLTQVQAKEWGKHGIRSNAICPGLIQSKFSKALWSNESFLIKLIKNCQLAEWPNLMKCQD